MNKPAFAAAFLITLSVFFLQQAVASPSLETAFVARVIDGDTFETGDGGTVRILEINTPEKGQFLYANASAFLKSLIEGRNVTMERDKTETDKYGRRLRYVFISGILVEEEMLRRGLASAYIIQPDEKYSERLIAAEQHTKENRLGLWNAGDYSYCLSVSEFHFDAHGNDLENLNDEYVSFRNICDSGTDFTNWTLKDSGTKAYRFKKLFLNPNRTVKVFSGCGKNTGAELFWCSKKPIWNNDGDTLYLRDSQGLLVLSKSYAGNGE